MWDFFSTFVAFSQYLNLIRELGTQVIVIKINLYGMFNYNMIEGNPTTIQWIENHLQGWFKFLTKS